jgi:hypothetical protein
MKTRSKLKYGSDAPEEVVDNEEMPECEAQDLDPIY